MCHLHGNEEALLEGKDMNMWCLLHSLLINLFIIEKSIFIETGTKCFTIKENYLWKITMCQSPVTYILCKMNKMNTWTRKSLHEIQILIIKLF